MIPNNIKKKKKFLIGNQYTGISLSAIPFFQISQYSEEEKFLKTGINICNKISDFQNLDGSIRLHQRSNVINLHTMCYTLEGLVYAYYVTKNENYFKIW